MTIQERILQYIENKGIKPYRFCKDLGLSQGYLDKRGAIGTDKYLKIIEYYNDVSPEWLLTGNGEMLKGQERYSGSGYIPATIVNKPAAKYGINGVKPIPLVSQMVAAGLGNSDFNIREQDIKAYYVVPKFRFRKIDFMIEITGSSMYPKYNSGDIIACTIIRESQFIQWNKCHVIATTEQGLLVKRIKEGSDAHHILAISDNKEYPPFEIPKSEIKGIAIVTGVIRLE